MSYPLSYIFSGEYYWDMGRSYNQTLTGLYWSSTMSSAIYNFRLYTNGIRLFKTSGGDKRDGLALRCVTAHGAAKLSSTSIIWVNAAIWIYVKTIYLTITRYGGRPSPSSSTNIV